MQPEMGQADNHGVDWKHRFCTRSRLRENASLTHLFVSHALYAPVETGISFLSIGPMELYRSQGDCEAERTIVPRNQTAMVEKQPCSPESTPAYVIECDPSQFHWNNDGLHFV
jgi:hypothetical protein